jgi:hypothetical protein
MKKIGSVVNPLTIVKSPNYQTLLDYWNNGGTKPTSGFAYYTLMQMAQNANIQSCIYRKDVIDAMFRQVSDSTTKPFAKLHIPGAIPASDYDLGRYGKAYSDAIIANYNVTTGTYTEWNTGWSYRNDGVDIQSSTDAATGANGYNVGWTSDKEWLQYSATVDSGAAYTVNFRYAILGVGSKIRLQLNDGDVTETLSLPTTGGYQTWANFTINDVIAYKGQQKIKVIFDKGGTNFSFLRFTMSKRIEDIVSRAVSAETHLKTELIYVSCNKNLVDSTVKADGFSCTVNGTSVNISSLVPSNSNPNQIILGLDQQIFDIDIIKLSYADGGVKATDGTLLQNFTDMPVRNNLPVYTLIPGKIEAESFSVNQGLQTETCTDAGGGQNVGYTNTGDYLEYQVRVMKTSKYYLELRIASAGTAGRLEVQQLNAEGTVVNSVLVNIPVTGGWQAWKTIAAAIDLNAGVCTLRVKILLPEFNINWFRFSETAQGIHEDTGSVFSIFPNPAKDEISVLVPASSGQTKTIRISSSTGLLMKTVEIAQSEISKKIAVGEFSKGLYMVELEMAGVVYRNKLIVQ